jgi:hypothetical protein
MAPDDETTPQNNAGTAAPAKSGKAARPKTNHPLPTDRIASKKQIEIVRAYGQLGASGGAVTNEDVGGMVQLTGTTTSLANAFLTDVGLLQRTPDGLAPSADVIAFARAFEWNADTAGEKLAPTLEASWLGSALLRKIRFRTHTKQEALALLAEASGASASHRGQLEDILVLLELAALIVIDGDSVRAGKMMQAGGAAVAPAPAVPETTQSVAPKVVEATASTSRSQAGHVLSFDISLSVTMAEITLLPADKIAAFFNGVAAVVAVQAQIEAIKKGDGVAPK